MDARLSEYQWKSAESPTELPLIIASRVLDHARVYLEGAETVCDAIPEANTYQTCNADDEFQFTSLVFPWTRTRRTVITGGADGGLEVQVIRDRKTVGISVEAFFAGPSALPYITFMQKSSGKKGVALDMQHDRGYSLDHIERCWNISSVVAAAFEDIRYRIVVQRWPAR